MVLLAKVTTDPRKLAEARALRDRGVSIRMIAAMTGLPRSTVGDHLKGEGETVCEIHCERCGAETVAFSGRQRYCTPGCAVAAWYEENYGSRAAYQRERRRRRATA